MKIRRIVCLLVTLTMVFSMTTVTADAASFKTAPKGVKAKCVSGASVKVSCKAKKGATGYCFYYNTKKGGKYKLGATSTSKSAVIKGLTAGKKYYFKVRAYKGTDTKKYSKMSKAVKCQTVLKKPKATVTDKCGCKVCFRLSGQDGTKGFTVYRSTKKKKGYKKIKTVSGGPVVTWNDRSIKASKTYYYKVVAVSGKYKSPESKVVKVKTDAWHPEGNDARFDPAKSGESQYADDFANRNIFFLGSSITYGSASKGIAFPDYLAARNNLECVQCIDGSGNNRIAPEAGSGVVWKEAVSGTTMARIGTGDSENRNSYSFRLHEYYQDTTVNPDVFVCQLSLNDANKNVPVGEFKGIRFDMLQGEGEEAYLEELYEDAYVYAKWPACQVMFYTISRFNGGSSANYINMMSLLNAEAETNNIAIIDLWNKASGLAYPSLSGNRRCMYMADAHHPKKAGYQQWTPYFESALDSIITGMPPVECCTVTWENWDGEVLETDGNVRPGMKPSFDKDEPVKVEDGEYTYTFVGWRVEGAADPGAYYTPEEMTMLAINSDTTFIAVFDSVPKTDSGTEEGGEGAGDGSSGPDQDNPDQDGQSDPDNTSVIPSLLRAA